MPRRCASDKQQQLAKKLAGLDEKMAAVGTVHADHERCIRIALKLVNCGEAYVSGSDVTRRAYIQSWFEGLHLGSPDHDVQVARVERT